ncbi:hypothetical protein CEXT_458711 [Caerostris extrusa]|uniref:Uncharacterized protein n=1 Tax=Caerostris extrusa TaxID=172846 RepID=A0AAV4MUB9_CAEEX|nr:hypothetical protein CEXT_458711 [Caerostris extrusa]
MSFLIKLRLGRRDFLLAVWELKNPGGLKASLFWTCYHLKRTRVPNELDLEDYSRHRCYLFGIEQAECFVN